MAYKSANEIMQMFADRKQLKWLAPSGCAWTQHNGSEGAVFWITRKQTDWLLGVYGQEVKAPISLNEAGGTIYIDGIETKWVCYQTSTKRNNGAGMVKLAR